MRGCPRPYPMHRLCFFCGHPIAACSAYTLARDVLACDAGRISRSLVREFCGDCDLTPGKVSSILASAGYYPGCGPDTGLW